MQSTFLSLFGDIAIELARKYGPIFELTVPGRWSRVVVSSVELVDQLCDESRFDKTVGGEANPVPLALSGFATTLWLLMTDSRGREFVNDVA